jgi:hypothetical protein
VKANIDIVIHFLHTEVILRVSAVLVISSAQEEVKGRMREGLLSYGAEYFAFQFAIQKFKIYRTIIVPGVLYGCETWSLTLREVCRLRVFENRELGEYLGLRRMR